jgi:methylmalonyl-CoA mutase, N-terminal domain
VQEVAFTLANAIAYVQAAIDAGLKVDEFADQLSFFFNAHNNFLEEVAKFRAARRLWAQIMRERFGAKTRVVDAALPHPDGRLDPDRPAA